MKGELWGCTGSKLLLGRGFTVYGLGSRGFGALSIRFQSSGMYPTPQLRTPKSATLQIFTGQLLQNPALQVLQNPILCRFVYVNPCTSGTDRLQ